MFRCVFPLLDNIPVHNVLLLLDIIPVQMYFALAG